MKRVLFLLLAVSTLLSSTAFAQKKDRKAAKAKQQQEAVEAINQAVNASSLRYLAQELTTAPGLRTANITLVGNYFVDLSPTGLKCYLPVYGSNKAYSGPQLRSRLEFFMVEGEFTVEKEPLKRGGWLVTIKTLKKIGVNDYTFRMTVTDNGRGSRLSVSTNFDSPSTYSGDVSAL